MTYPDVVQVHINQMLSSVCFTRAADVPGAATSYLGMKLCCDVRRVQGSIVYSNRRIRRFGAAIETSDDRRNVGDK